MFLIVWGDFVVWVFLFVRFFLLMNVEIIGFLHPIFALLSEFGGFPGGT